jgi:hypothetical protein
MLGLTEAKKLVVVELITRRSWFKSGPRNQKRKRLVDYVGEPLFLRFWPRGPDSART